LYEGYLKFSKIPEDAISVSETPMESITGVELKEDAQKPIYSITGKKPARLLFIIPVSMEIETEVSAESGELISVNKPWWSFLAW
jgi:hypothetical protein